MTPVMSRRRARPLARELDGVEDALGAAGQRHDAIGRRRRRRLGIFDVPRKKDEAGAEAEEAGREANQGHPAAERPPVQSIHRSAGRVSVRFVIPIAVDILAKLGGC